VIFANRSSTAKASPPSRPDCRRGASDAEGLRVAGLFVSPYFPGSSSPRLSALRPETLLSWGRPDPPVTAERQVLTKKKMALVTCPIGTSFRSNGGQRPLHWTRVTMPCSWLAQLRAPDSRSASAVGQSESSGVVASVTARRAECLKVVPQHRGASGARYRLASSGGRVVMPGGGRSVCVGYSNPTTPRSVFEAGSPRRTVVRQDRRSSWLSAARP
jgi:hypothetical protein